MFVGHEVHFRLGEAVHDTTMDGRNILFVIHQPLDDQWVERQWNRNSTVDENNNTPIHVPRSSPTTTLTRQFLADQMVVTLKANEVISSSIFRRKTN